MNDIYKKALESKEYIENKISINPKIGIILGSGLGNFTEIVEDKVEIEYKDIPNFPVSTVEGHQGRLVIGKIEGKEVIIMKGRFHYYEGYNMDEVTFPIRVFSLLGVQKMIITNSAGGVNLDLEVGDIMIIKDHIKLFSETPLRGKNIDEFGVRFPDMRNVYDVDMINTFKEVSGEENVKVKEGIYFYMAGPQYETPAEVKVIRTLGGDAVGMSTVPEVIVCSHSNIKVLRTFLYNKCIRRKYRRTNSC